MHLHRPSLSSVQRKHQAPVYLAPRRARPFRSLCRPAQSQSSSNSVVISYEELSDPKAKLDDKIRDAFGPSGLGIVLVYGVPGYGDMRRRLLPLAPKLWGLPKDVLIKYVNAASSYSVGVSRGRKGHPNLESQEMASFYANPLQDKHNLAPELIAASSAFYSENLWPEELPELEPAFKELGACIVAVGVLVAGHCSRYVQQELIQKRGGGDVPDDLLQHLDFAGQLAASNTTKGRLIYYPPPSSQASAPEDPTADWCGRHRDFGSLTGLTAPLYLQAGVEVPVPDPEAGLYVETGDGSAIRDVQVIIPDNCMAFQIGRVMGIQSGGVLRPTRHFVQAPAAVAVMPSGAQQAAAAGGGTAQEGQGVGGAAGVSRNTLAVFMQPRLDTPLVAPNGADELRRELGDALVGGKWQDGITFGDFAKRELAG